MKELIYLSGLEVVAEVTLERRMGLLTEEVRLKVYVFSKFH